MFRGDKENGQMEGERAIELTPREYKKVEKKENGLHRGRRRWKGPRSQLGRRGEKENGMRPLEKESGATVSGAEAAEERRRRVPQA